jgi:hypothetical protein
MALQVILDGQDITKYCDLPSLAIKEDVLNDQWECNFNMLIPNRVIPRPKSNTEFKVINGAEDEFAGVMATAKEKQIDPVTMQWACISNNYKQWFDRHLVAEDYPQQAADAILKAMVQAYCPGFSTNHVQAAPVVPEQKYDYKAPSQNTKNLANLLSWQWYIDYSKDVHFFSAESIPSPLRNNTLDADTDLVSYGDLILEEDGTQVKNRIIAKGFYITSQSPVPIYISCDGQNDTYPLPQMPAGTSSKYISVSVGGHVYTPKADVAAGLPSDTKKNDYTAYINSTNQTVRFDPTPAAGSVATGEMYYKYQPVYIQDDPVLIAQMQQREADTDGVYEYAIQDPRMTGDDTGLAQARTGYALAKYGSPNITGTLISYLPGWHAGQSFYLTSNNRFDGEIQNKWMYVAQCSKKVVTHPLNGTPVFQSTLTISDRPFIWGGS